MNATQRRNASRRSRRGFSLIELMVVIVIIGVLGTAAVFAYQAAIGDSKESVAINDLRQIAEKVNIYKTQKDTYPTSLEEVATALKLKLPDADPWNRTYEYDFDDEGYTILSKGQKENDDGDDIVYSSERGKVMRRADMR